MTAKEQHDRFRQFALIERIATALERMAPARPAPADFSAADAFIWHPSPGAFQPVPKVNRVPLDLLRAIAPMRERLLDNTVLLSGGLTFSDGKLKLVERAELFNLRAGAGKADNFIDTLTRTVTFFHKLDWLPIPGDRAAITQLAKNQD